MWNWALTLLLTILGLYLLYTLGADLVFKLLHIGTFYRGFGDQRSVALTFDDGPDPKYTPQVLQILKDHDVRATFFVVAEDAANYRDIMKVMVQDGHEVASHSYFHRHAWLRHPVNTWRDIHFSHHLLRNLTGTPVRYYRPPWGDFNLMTRIACLAHRMTPVLWTHRAMDWIASKRPEDIVDAVVLKATPGSIVLCHDAGGEPDAPLNMIAALPEILSRLRQLGFSFATVGQLHVASQASRFSKGPFAHYPLHRRILIAAWGAVEFAFAKAYRVLVVDAIFRVSLTWWHHGSRTDDDTGVAVIRDGDKAVDLHFHNETLINMMSDGDTRAAVRAVRMARTGLRNIARLLEYHPEYADVNVVTAVTLMNRGVDMLGFHVEELPNRRKWRRMGRYMRFLLGMYHPLGFRRLHEGTQTLTLKLIWMTRDELLARYGSHTSHVSNTSHTSLES